MTVSLKAGGNYVVYTGIVQSAADAFASIMNYLDQKEVAYYWNNLTGLHDLVITTTTLMVPYGVYWIEVTQDCTWTYGIETAAPSGVQLYSRTVDNMVAYSGPAQSAQGAFTSIDAYLVLYYHFNNVTKVWEFTLTMVPNGVYFVKVSQNCVWTFVTAPPPPTFEGTITGKELEYNESRGNIPVSDVPQGKNGLVHIWGRNDMGDAQRMGISWIVKDPDGVTVEDYSTWEAWPYTGAGAEHEFIGGRFNLDKPGTYTINIGLIMNPDAPVYVHTYYGNLCTVIPALVPTFSNFGITAFSKV